MDALQCSANFSGDHSLCVPIGGVQEMPHVDTNTHSRTLMIDVFESVKKNHGFFVSPKSSL